jgi:predicted TIM-barrel fold metal-dependent hydrolase
MNDAEFGVFGASLGRRSFLAVLAASLAACSSKLVTTKYPVAERCSTAGCTMVDVHCHVFNASDLNISGFVSHILPVPRKLTTWLTDILAQNLHKRTDTAAVELAYIERMIAAGTRIGSKSSAVDADDLRKVARKLSQSALLQEVSSESGDVLDTLQLIIQRRSQIAARMSDQYHQIDLFTPALVDYQYWSPDKPKSPLVDQLRVQSALARASTLDLIGKKKARIHPIAPFNPLREVREVILEQPGDQRYEPFGPIDGSRMHYTCNADPVIDAQLVGALNPLRYAIESLGFVGAKVYPPTGFKPLENASWVHHKQTKLGPALDAALHAFYAYCEAEEVPLMTHANNSNGYNLGYGLLTGPDIWEQVLQVYPNLRLNLGHFGELEGDDPERGLAACELWMAKIADLMQRYPNVYADSGCSFVPVQQKFQERYLELLEQVYAKYDKTKLRFMYGSDFWLNKFYANSQTFVNAFAELFRQRFNDKAQDFFGNNALRFLGFLDDNGNKPSESRNRRRLQAWYGATPQPAWLAD